MIDNRGLLILAVETVEKFEESSGVSTLDSDKLLAFIESALQEAYRRGCKDCRVKSESEVTE